MQHLLIAVVVVIIIIIIIIIIIVVVVINARWTPPHLLSFGAVLSISCRLCSCTIPVAHLLYSSHP